MNYELRNKLDKVVKYWKSEGVNLVPYSDCCRTCLANKYDSELDKSNYFINLSLSGMNYDDEISTLYIMYDKLDFVSREKLTRLIDKYVEVLGLDFGEITWPDDDDAIIVELDDDIPLEEDPNNEDNNYDEDEEDDEDDY